MILALALAPRHDPVRGVLVRVMLASVSFGRSPPWVCGSKWTSDLRFGLRGGVLKSNSRTAAQPLNSVLLVGADGTELGRPNRALPGADHEGGAPV